MAYQIQPKDFLKAGFVELATYQPDLGPEPVRSYPDTVADMIDEAGDGKDEVIALAKRIASLPADLKELEDKKTAEMSLLREETQSW
jgi:hypothetical protein